MYVIYRHKGKFLPVVSWREAQGIKPDEIWIFGTAVMRGDVDILQSVEAATALLPAERVHRIK